MQRTGQTLPCQAPSRTSRFPTHPSLNRRCNTSAVEFLIVAYARGDAVYQNALRILDQPLVTLIPLDEEQMHAAALAHQTYGRGHHSARLNLGDTFPYALAKTRRLPLLYKGADFSQTDLTPAVPPGT